MSSDESRASDDAMGVVTTCVYDSQLGSIRYRNGVPCDADGRPIDPAELGRRMGALGPASANARTPRSTHTFEFRLSGSETQEKMLPLSEGSLWPANSILAIKSVRTYLTRDGEPVAANVIGGVEVDAELRPGGIFCTAKVSDFGVGEVVVVRVEVLLY